MAGPNILMYTTIAMVVIYLLLTILSSLAASKANSTSSQDIQTSRSYSITVAVISALSICLGVGALIATGYFVASASSKASQYIPEDTD